MQLIKKWSDKRYGTENFLYRLKAGVKLLFVNNPTSTETNLSISVKAGSQYEKSVKVTQGTAHFVEHLLYSPNEIHKTKQEIDSFEFGNKNKPSLLINGYTSYKTLTIHGKAHYKGQVRLAQRLLHIASYPEKLFSEYIEKERKIIISETKRDKKPERDKIYQFEKFMVDSQMPGYSRFTLGEEKDLKKITTEELIKFYRATFVKNNAIIAVQSPVKPSGKFLEILTEIAKRFEGSRGKPPRWPKEYVENRYRFGYFYNPDEEGTQIILSYFDPSPKKINYKKNQLFNLTKNLIWKVAFDHLREEKGLVYAFEPFYDNSTMASYDIEGFHFTVNHRNITPSLDLTYEIIYKKLEEFLLSDQGKKWFESFLSHFIFPKTLSFNPNYAMEKAFAIHHGYELPDFEKAVEVAKNITIKDLQKYLKTNFQNIPLHIFVASPKKEKEIRKAVYKSKLHKHWSSRIPQKLKK